MEVYILYGDDKFNINRRVNQIKNVVNSEWLQFNYCSLPDDADYLDIINEICTAGFGTGRKVVHVSNDCLFTKEANKAIKKLEIAPSDNTLLITTTKKPAINTVVVKELLKYGKLEEYQLISLWKPQEIASYIKKEAASYKINLTDDCNNYLVENLGNDTQLIDSELQKISLYAASDNISIEELRLLVRNQHANSIELAKCCLLGESKLAFEKLNQLNSHPLQITATLSSCFRTWLAVKAGIVENAGDSEIAKAGCIYNSKRIYFLKREVSDCSLVRLLHILSILIELEYELKIGKNTLISRVIEICEL